MIRWIKRLWSRLFGPSRRVRHSRFEKRLETFRRVVEMEEASK